MRRSGEELEGGVSIRGKTPEEWIKAAERWQGFGATHLRVDTMDARLTSPAAHIEAIRRFWDVLSPMVT